MGEAAEATHLGHLAIPVSPVGQEEVVVALVQQARYREAQVYLGKEILEVAVF